VSDEKQILQMALEMCCDEMGHDASYWTDRAAMALAGPRDTEMPSMSMACRAAHVTARAAMLNAEIAGLQAGNLNRADRGHAPAYDDDAFTEVYNRYKDLELENLTAFLLGKQD
jgi:hypothetical protein